MKRTIAISLLFLANLVLMAVTVVPHHHHGDLICLIGSHCHHGHDHSCCHHDTQPADTEQEHDHSAGASCCHVGEWLLSDVESAHRHQHYCYCTTCHGGHVWLVAIFSVFFEPFLQPVALPFRQTSTDPIVLQTFAGRIHGLRAPPFHGTTC